MRSIQESVLEEFLLQTKDKDMFVNFFKGASLPAKIGYTKGIYKEGTSVVNGYYVEFDSRGIKVWRDEQKMFTWQQVVGKIEELIEKGKYGEPDLFFDTQQMNFFDLIGAAQ